MQKRFRKYFWDGIENRSPKNQLQRIFEYASFPGLINYPFGEVKKHIGSIDPGKMRTGEKRKKFLLHLKPFVPESNSWEEAIHKMIAPFFEEKYIKISDPKFSPNPALAMLFEKNQERF